jgi:hypothetical protein
LGKNLNPVYRDKYGNPSREELVNAVKRRKISRKILQIHNYIYDLF